MVIICGSKGTSGSSGSSSVVVVRCGSIRSGKI